MFKAQLFTKKLNNIVGIRLKIHHETRQENSNMCKKRIMEVVSKRISTFIREENLKLKTFMNENIVNV